MVRSGNKTLKDGIVRNSQVAAKQVDEDFAGRHDELGSSAQSAAED